MTLEEKIEVIKENKEPTIAALDAVLDTIYNFTDPITNDKGNVKTSLFKNQKAEETAVQLRKDIEKYEPIRGKLKVDDFNLSALEIGYINAAYVFCIQRAQNTIESMAKAHKLMVDISTKLTELPPNNSVVVKNLIENQS